MTSYVATLLLHMKVAGCHLVLEPPVARHVHAAHIHPSLGL